MDPYIKEISKTQNLMVLEHYTTKIKNYNTLVIGKMEFLKVKDNKYMEMVINIRELFIMVSTMVKEYINGAMEEYMRVNLKMVLCKEKEICII